MDKKFIVAQAAPIPAVPLEPPSIPGMFMDGVKKVYNGAANNPMLKQDEKTGLTGVEQGLKDSQEKLGFDETGAFASGASIGLNIQNVDAKVNELYMVTGALKSQIFGYLQQLVRCAQMCYTDFESVYKVGLYLLSKYNADTELSLSVLNTIAEYAAKDVSLQLMNLAANLVDNPGLDYLPLISSVNMGNSDSFSATAPAPSELIQAFSLIATPNAPLAASFKEHAMTTQRKLQTTEALEIAYNLNLMKWLSAANKKSTEMITGFYNLFNEYKDTPLFEKVMSGLSVLFIGADLKNLGAGAMGVKGGIIGKSVANNKSVSTRAGRYVLAEQFDGNAFAAEAANETFKANNGDWVTKNNEYVSLKQVYSRQKESVKNVLSALEQRMGRTNANDVSAITGDIMEMGSKGMVTSAEIEQMADTFMNLVNNMQISLTKLNSLFQEQRSKQINTAGSGQNVAPVIKDGVATYPAVNSGQSGQATADGIRFKMELEGSLLAKEQMELVGFFQSAYVAKAWYPIKRDINLMQISIAKDKKHIADLNGNVVTKTQVGPWIIKNYIPKLQSFIPLYKKAIANFSQFTAGLQNNPGMLQFIKQKQDSCYKAITDVATEIQQLLVNLAYQGYGGAGSLGEVTMTAKIKEGTMRMADIYKDEEADNKPKSDIYEDTEEVRSNDIYQDDKVVESDEKMRKYWDKLLPGYGDALEYPQKNRNIPTRKIKFKRTKKAL